MPSTVDPSTVDEKILSKTKIHPLDQKIEQNTNNTKNTLLDNFLDMKKYRDAKKVAEGVNNISGLHDIYFKYEKEFADMVARYAIKNIIDHRIKYGDYKYLHDGLLSSSYLNQEEKEKIEKNIDAAARNYIKMHSGV